MADVILSSNERLLTSDEIKRLMEVYRIRGTLNSSLADLMQECAQRGFDKANTHETEERLRVRLAKDIYDDGQDHHPPSYVGRKGDVVVIHSIQTAVVSHRGTGGGFVVHDGELELSGSQKANSCVCGEPNSPGTHRTDGPCLAPIGDHHP